MPTLYEVLEDDDFMPEFRQSNELLLKFLTQEKMCQVIRLVTEEPAFNDNPSRCFKLPFVATQVLCVENVHNSQMIFDDEDFTILKELMKFINVKEEVQLNSTLCGYFNKILSFWLIKKPNQMIRYIKASSNFINDLINHIYLNSSIIDILVRICCI